MPARCWPNVSMPALLARESQVRRRAASPVHNGCSVKWSQTIWKPRVSHPMASGGTPGATRTWRWTVQASWILDGTERQAHFNFDLVGRVSAAADEQARALINEAPRATGPGGDLGLRADDRLNDELALVRAVQADTEPPAVVLDQPSARIIKLPGELTRTRSRTTTPSRRTGAGGRRLRHHPQPAQ